MKNSGGMIFLIFLVAFAVLAVADPWHPGTTHHCGTVSRAWIVAARPSIDYHFQLVGSGADYQTADESASDWPQTGQYVCFDNDYLGAYNITEKSTP